MKKLCLIFLIILIPNFLLCQETLVEKFESKILEETRTIRVHIPKSFNNKTDNYPLILTLDGEYMFYNLAGNYELLLATEKITLPNDVYNYIATEFPFRKILG